MALAPGETGTLHVATRMPDGMGGPHDFRITVESNDLTSPETVITVIADFGPWGS